MSTLSDVGAGLQAALMLARGRAEGMTLIASRVEESGPEAEAASAARSFWAIALSLPAFVALHLLDWAQTGLPPAAAHQFALDLIGYLIGWLAFALLSHRIAVMLGRSARWPRFITVWNWCNVVQYLMLVVGTALPQLLEMPAMVQQTAWLVAMGWALWLEWYATRLALDTTPLQAIALVGADFAIGLFVLGLTGTS
jgi:hypothetical protein